MKDILIVMNFTMKEMVKRKSFIISTIVLLLTIVVGFNIPKLISVIKGEDSSSSKIVLYAEDEDSKELVNSIVIPDTEIIVANNYDEVKEKILSDECEYGFKFKNGEAPYNLKLTYLAKNGGALTQMPQTTLQVLQNSFTDYKLMKAGVSPEQIQESKPIFDTQVEFVENQIQGNSFVMMFLCLVLFYAIIFCTMQVATSVTTEKTSKIMETLVTSTKPRTIIIGKTLGVGIVGLLQVSALVVTAVLSAKFFLDPAILEMILSNADISVGTITVGLVYFVLGYLLYSFAYALTGSTVSKPEDIQSVNGPVSIVAAAGFYLAYFTTIMSPTSGLNKLATILPISSPFSMPLRMMMGLATPQDLIISIAVLILSIVLIAFIAIRVYTNAIINYGTKLSDIGKLFKQK